MKTKPLYTRVNGVPSPCIWMQAGVVRRKFCRTDYQCAACRYDAVLHRLAEENRGRGEQVAFPAGKKSKVVSWKDKLNERPPWKRPCLHYMKGRIEYRACTNEYRCSDCEFDQFFFDQFSVHAAVQPIDLIDIEGFKIPQGFYLHRGHTWAKIEEENTVRVGLDEFVLRTIGPVDRIDTPLIGKTVRQDAPDIALRRGIKTAKALSPISGVVTATNPKLLDQGRVNSREAYSEGWIMRIHADNLRRELKDLMINAETAVFIEKETRRLYRVIEEAAGPLAADGGQLVEDICGQLPQLDWTNIARLFLRS
jgi:glycine cleavage system H lipoate-binding protein